MLARKLIREQPEIIRQALADRGCELDLDNILDLEKQRCELTGQVERLKSRRNQVSEQIAVSKKTGQDVQAEIIAMRGIGGEIKILDNRLNDVESRLDSELLQIPNIPHSSVPPGDERANQEIHAWGEFPSGKFEYKPHWELGECSGILDPVRAAKITGARFMVYRGAGARLERALIQFMLDINIQEGGYTEIFPPLLVNREAMIGTGQLPKMEKDMFRTQAEEYYLIPTAEVPVTNLHRDETLNADQLPIKYVAYTPCFRREAGNYGKDTKGIVRQHQFNKVELVKIVRPETAYAELETLVQDAEKILQKLELPYRTIILSTGDMSFASAKSYDIEVWHAGARRYWEVSSCSVFGDFQARRANIRFRDEAGKVQYCNTLNGSGLATSRLLPAIMENYQEVDGSINMPPALVTYLGGRKKITPDGEWE
ncbi:serine--tRNA ligase [bacterium]|nr:serine--tRNA ligase [bacterium]